MLSLQDVQAVDREGLWNAYTKWPDSIRRALLQPLNLPKVRSFSSVVLAGMGGSGSACDILADWVRPKIRVPVSVIKDYRLPGYAGPETLAVLVSLGGKTKETRSLLRQSVDRGCSAVSMASGETIEEMSAQLKVPFNRVERLLVPRASIPSMVIVGARILAGLGVFQDTSDLESAAKGVEGALAHAAAAVPFDRNISKKLASELRGKRVAVYSPPATASVAMHFKNSMNENAKVPVQVETYPELFHNEVETWVARRDRAVVMLRVSELEENTKGELNVLKKLLKRFNVPVTEMRTDGCGLQTYLAWSLTLDLATVYLAVLEGRAPAPTPILSQMKKD
jgi:glucose/mannose-6-phosphate isomerase